MAVSTLRTSCTHRRSFCCPRAERVSGRWRSPLRRGTLLLPVFHQAPNLFGDSRRGHFNKWTVRCGTPAVLVIVSLQRHTGVQSCSRGRENCSAKQWRASSVVLRQTQWSVQRRIDLNRSLKTASSPADHRGFGVSRLDPQQFICAQPLESALSSLDMETLRWELLEDQTR